MEASGDGGQEGERRCQRSARCPVPPPGGAAEPPSQHGRGAVPASGRRDDPATRRGGEAHSECLKCHLSP